jgi:asparagine synthase (glutamine-hydrolysing)
LFGPELIDGVGQAADTLANFRHQHPVTFAAFRQSPWWHYGILALEQTQLTVRSPFLDNDFVRTVYRAPTLSHDVRLRLVSDGNSALGRIPTDRGVGGDSGRVSAAVSRMLLDFTYKAEYAYDSGMPQWLARVDHRLSPLRLERLFLGRHKMFHFRVWYRDALAQYVKDMLLDPRSLSRPYLEPKAVERVVAGHLRGDRNYTGAIHKVLMLELVHRLFVDAQ